MYVVLYNYEFLLFVKELTRDRAKLPWKYLNSRID